MKLSNPLYKAEQIYLFPTIVLILMQYFFVPEYRIDYHAVYNYHDYESWGVCVGGASVCLDYKPLKSNDGCKTRKR